MLAYSSISSFKEKFNMRLSENEVLELINRI